MLNNSRACSPLCNYDVFQLHTRRRNLELLLGVVAYVYIIYIPSQCIGQDRIYTFTVTPTQQSLKIPFQRKQCHFVQLQAWHTCFLVSAMQPIVCWHIQVLCEVLYNVVDPVQQSSHSALYKGVGLKFDSTITIAVGCAGGCAASKTTQFIQQRTQRSVWWYIKSSQDLCKLILSTIVTIVQWKGACLQSLFN